MVTGAWAGSRYPGSCARQSLEGQDPPSAGGSLYHGPISVVHLPDLSCVWVLAERRLIGELIGG